jgi:hypothetical protein
VIEGAHMSEDITAVDEVALSRTIGDFLGECMENGFVLPLHVAVIAVNGSSVVFGYTAADGGWRTANRCTC